MDCPGGTVRCLGSVRGEARLAGPFTASVPSVLHRLLNVSYASNLGSGNLAWCVAEPIARAGITERRGGIGPS